MWEEETWLPGGQGRNEDYGAQSILDDRAQKLAVLADFLLRQTHKIFITNQDRLHRVKAERQRLAANTGT